MDDPEQAIRDYFERLGQLVASFNFTRPGRDESMGKDAAQIVAEGIHDRGVNDHSGPDGIWLANDPEYARRKRAKYQVDPTLVGVRTGQMLSLPSLLGQVDVTPDLVEIRYGTGQPPTSSMTGYITTQDTSISDIEKAWFFTRLKGRFFALDATIAQAVRDHFAAELDSFIRELNSRA